MIKSAQEVCESTEDLFSRVEGCSKTNDLSTSIIGSIDVIALYPSIDVEFAVSKCKEPINERDVEFQKVDLNELGLFLMLTTSQESRDKSLVKIAYVTFVILKSHDFICDFLKILMIIL